MKRMKCLFVACAAAFGLVFGAFAESFVNLTTVKDDLVVTDGTRLHAVLHDSGSISIAPNATVTLWGAIIQESSSMNGAGITCLGDATIILECENYICGRSRGFPAIYVPKGSTLTIKGPGKLTAIGNGWAAGIGGGEGLNCGNIVIDGGMITAEGGDSSDIGSISYITDDMIIPPDSNYKKNSIIIRPPSNDGGGPGIGAARDASCGSITFNRGNVTAFGHKAPAIGNGDSSKKCGKITFNRAIGDVHAAIKTTDNTHDCIEPASKVVNNCRYLNGYVDTTYNSWPGKQSDVIYADSYKTRTIGSPLGEIRSNKTYKNNTIDGGSYFIPCDDLGYYWGDNHSPEGHYLLAGNERRSKATEIPCLRGALSGDYRISIADGAIVELFDVTIGPSLKSDIPGITCNGDATIILYGDNYVAGHGDQYPGIYVPKGKTVKFIGPGSLTAVGGGDYGVGIGSCGPNKERGGTVEILSGNITAIGGKYAAALGGSFLVQDGESIEVHADGVSIKNGTVHTKGAIYNESSFDVASHMTRTIKGNEEFYRWNGELDNLPVGPWIYAVAHDGTVIRGSLPGTNEDAGGYLPLVTIAPDAEVELLEARLFANTYTVKIPWHDLIKEPRIGGGVLRCEGNATIKLSNGPRAYNVIKSQNETCPGIVVPEGATLTFTGDGSLYIQGGESSFAMESLGTVIFDGGVVNVFDWPWDSSAPIESSSCETLWGGNYVFKRGSVHLYCDIDKNSQPPRISRFFNEDASREFGKGMVQGSGAQEWTDAPGAFDKGYWRNDITWDGSLDDLDEEEQGAGMKMKAMSALPALKSAKLLGAGDPDPTEFAGLLNDVASDAIAGDGAVITGRLSGRHKISIAPGATVTLRDATIWPASSSADSPYAGLTCLGDATIILEGENIIGSFNSYFPAIRSAAGCTLTIEGAGYLYAKGGDYAAAIGGAAQKDCGSIVVKGGDIEAFGGANSDVIGKGMYGTCNSVSVASGISRLVLNKGESGLWGITDISSVIAYTSEGTNKRIYKWSGNLSGVTASDTPVELTALDGTTITGSNASGAYKKVNVKIAPGARVTLDSVTIDASTANLPNAEFLGTVAQWAGITCLGDAEITLVGENRVDSFNCEYPCVYVPKGSTLTIKGSGSLLADNTRNHARGAGIGGGSRKGINNDCGRIVIDGGTVHGYSNGYSTDSGYTEGLGYSAGIGSGPDGWCEGIEIGAGITEVRGWNKAGSGETRPQFSALPIGGGARGSAQVYPAHGLTDNYIATWADRVFRSIPRVDLSQATGDVTITMDSIVTGRLPGNGQYKVTIAAGAEVTLKDVTIYGKGAGINCAGNASIWIEGMNLIKGQDNCPGIYVPEGWTLNIYAKSASDYLEAIGGANAAGIGSGKGGSDLGNAGCIWIHGGHVVATGGSWGAGIGTGSSTENGTKSNCYYIGIDGGSVLATGGSGAAGIGSGWHSTCGDIYIGPDITRVVAVRGNNAAHVGRGNNGSCGEVEIDSSLRDRTEGLTGSRRILEYNPDKDLSSVIGTASDEDELEVLLLDTAVVSGKLTPVRRIVVADGATVTISNVTITGTYNPTYDGQCEWAGITCEGDATIILEGTNNITGYYEDYPGIYVPPKRTLTIKGDGVLNASGSVGSADSKWAPGIGGGYMIDGGNIVIEGGIIKASGGKCAAGIGGGRSASIGTIEINGGSVVSEGGEGSPGIGAGAGSSCEGVSIGKGISFVSATGGVGGSTEVSPIGPSEEGSCAKLSIAGALVQAADGNNLTIMPAKMDLGRVFDNIVVQDGMTLTGTLEAKCRISVAPNARITLKDAVIPGSNATGDSWAGLTCTSNAVIVLEGENTVRSHGRMNGYPGIYVPEGSTLAIEGEGSLTVETSEDNWGGAGIGGGSYLPNCGNITINGGVVVARSYHWAAGIGGGGGKRCGTISIGPGIKSVTATCAAGNEPIGAAQSMTFDGLEVDSSLIDATSADGLTRTIKSPIVDLSTLNGDFVLQDKAVATGALAENVKVSIADGATITLRDATINGENDKSYTWAGISCEGNATIILEGSNTVKGFYEDYPGIHVPENKTLTIRGDGSLDASSNGWAAGIGAGRGIHCGNIVIDGGSINAVGGEYSAGIGGASKGNCGNITITRNVTSVCATRGPYNSHSIGAGSGSVGTVTIGGVEGAISISPFVYKPWNGNLDTLDGDATVANGTIVTGTLDGGYAIYLEDGATNYLYNATINGKLVCKGSATIVISGNNWITSTVGAAIIVPANHQADIIGNGTLLATGTSEIVNVSVDSSFDCVVKDNGNTYEISLKASTVEEIKLSGYEDWAAEKGLSGAWDARDANGVANAFRYVFDVTDPDVQESDFLGIAMGEDGRVVIMTPEVVNKGVFNLSVVASDSPDGTGNVVEYPLSSDGETAIDEVDATSRFFRIRVDIRN